MSWANTFCHWGNITGSNWAIQDYSVTQKQCWLHRQTGAGTYGLCTALFMWIVFDDDDLWVVPALGTHLVTLYKKVLPYHTPPLTWCKIHSLTVKWKLRRVTGKVAAVWGNILAVLLSSGFIRPNAVDVRSACLFFVLAAVFLSLIFVTTKQLEVPVYVVLISMHHAEWKCAACIRAEKMDYCCLAGSDCVCAPYLSTCKLLGLILQGRANNIPGRSHACVLKTDTISVPCQPLLQTLPCAHA